MPAWVKDEEKWQDAKREAEDSISRKSPHYWQTVAIIYQKMISKALDSSVPLSREDVEGAVITPVKRPQKKLFSVKKPQ